MNVNCYGDFFKADGLMYYRCYWDGKIFTYTTTKTCENCKRPIDGHQRGELKTRTVKVVMLSGHTEILP